jgi:hypothetical protein
MEMGIFPVLKASFVFAVELRQKGLPAVNPRLKS